MPRNKSLYALPAPLTSSTSPASSQHYGHLGIKNSIRPTALGKKNFLFFGHPEAGERSAVIYTLLGSCRRQGVNPFDYMKDLFTRLPAAKITQIKDFAPMARVKAKEKVVALAA